MRLRRGWFVGALLVVCLAGAGCTKASSGEEESSGGAASTQAIAGSDAVRVTLTPAAARRLDVQTAPVADARSSGHAQVLEVPYAAILYDPAGDTWVYTATE